VTQNNYLEQIRNRIKNSATGTIFVLSDFADIADYDSIKQSLSRLNRIGFIRRITRGIYEYPEYSEFLKELVAPDSNKIALALARNYGWSIVPYGDTALNLLGLSTQVPAVWTYVSDGPYKKYAFDNTTLRFKRIANKDVSKLSYMTALVVQAIKAIGKDGLDNNIISKLRKVLSDSEKSAMIAEGKYMTSWVYETVKKICRGVET
jgi:hypothetical protein